MLYLVIRIAILIGVTVGVADTVVKMVRFEPVRRAFRETSGKKNVPFSQALQYERLNAEVSRSRSLSFTIMLLGVLALVLLTPDLRNALAGWMPVPPDWMRTERFMYWGGGTALGGFLISVIWSVFLQVRYKRCLRYFEATGNSYYSDPSDLESDPEKMKVYQVDTDHHSLDMMVWDKEDTVKYSDLAEGLSELEQYKLTVYLLRRREKNIVKVFSWITTIAIALVSYGQLAEFLL